MNACRRLFGLPHWSLARYLKLRLRHAARYMDAFEHAAARAAAQQELDGIVCGHIHRAEMREIDGVLYCNDGDWVESCTAMVEDNAGRFRCGHGRMPARHVLREKLVEVAA